MEDIGNLGYLPFNLIGIVNFDNLRSCGSHSAGFETCIRLEKISQVGAGLAHVFESDFVSNREH
jgi:hypothetical protein